MHTPQFSSCSVTSGSEVVIAIQSLIRSVLFCTRCCLVGYRDNFHWWPNLTCAIVDLQPFVPLCHLCCSVHLDNWQQCCAVLLYPFVCQFGAAALSHCTTVSFTTLCAHVVSPCKPLDHDVSQQYLHVSHCTTLWPSSTLFCAQVVPPGVP